MRHDRLRTRARQLAPGHLHLVPQLEIGLEIGVELGRRRLDRGDPPLDQREQRRALLLQPRP
jgi:hypothetical protein